MQLAASAAAITHTAPLRISSDGEREVSLLSPLPPLPQTSKNKTGFSPSLAIEGSARPPGLEAGQDDHSRAVLHVQQGSWQEHALRFRSLPAHALAPALWVPAVASLAQLGTRVLADQVIR